MIDVASKIRVPFVFFATAAVYVEEPTITVDPVTVVVGGWRDTLVKVTNSLNKPTRKTGQGAPAEAGEV